MRTIYIDDSGWGFPLGGVLCGAYDTLTGQFIYREVETQYFQEVFKSKQYLKVFAERAGEIMAELKAGPKDTKLVMCRGYILNEAYRSLRRLGFKIERTTIREPLQSNLESYHRQYVHKLGYGAYYDPKDIPEAQVPKEFNKAIEWAYLEGREDLLKSGWGYFDKNRHVLKKYRDKNRQVRG